MCSDSEKILDFSKSKWEKFKTEYKGCKKEISAENVHDIRVSLRRLMALNEILSPLLGISDKKAKKRCTLIKKNIKLFGPLRDVHIAIDHIQSLNADFPESRPFYNHLICMENKLSRRLSKNIESVDYRQIKHISNSLIRHISSCSEDSRLYSGLCQGAAYAFYDVMSKLQAASSDDMKSLHIVRVAFKRFRYMTEVIDRLNPLCQNSHDAMQQLQDSFGYIQDISVIEGLVSEFLNKNPSGSNSVRGIEEELLKRQEDAAALLLCSTSLLDSLNPSRIFR